MSCRNTRFPRPFCNTIAGCAGTDQLDIPNMEFPHLVLGVPRSLSHLQEVCVQSPMGKEAGRLGSDCQRATTHNQRMTIESARDFWPVQPKDDKRSASDDQQVTKRSAESVPPEPRGLRGRGGERPFSNCESARSAALSRERGSKMTADLKTLAQQIGARSLFWR
jgi:hypothetical protein